MKNSKILGLIGLAARARKVSFGADSVELEAQKNKVYLIILAQDSSSRTKEKLLLKGRPTPEASSYLANSRCLRLPQAAMAIPNGCCGASVIPPLIFKPRLHGKLDSQAF